MEIRKSIKHNIMILPGNDYNSVARISTPQNGSRYYMPEQTAQDAGISRIICRVFGDFYEYLLKVSTVIIVSGKIVKRQPSGLNLLFCTKPVQAALWIVRNNKPE
ncbi:MAG: hypothetical protein G8D61_04305 [gamma proteobacterium symbiont of Ctena orbiculata]